MKQAFCSFIAVVFLFGAAVVHGQAFFVTVQNIDCSDASRIFFEISIPDIDEWEGSTDARSWSLNNILDEACQPTFDQDEDLVIYNDINVDTCHLGGPAITPDGSKFEYEFKISVDAVAGSATAPVTFAYDHDYVVKCFYNREKENIGASFQPLHSLAASGSAVGDDFTILFTVHYESTGLQVTSTVDLSTPVFGKIEITDPSGIPENLDVHLREVTARDSTSMDGGFVLIHDGCAYSAVVTDTSCDTDSEDRFYFNIFRFPGQSDDDEVLLRAKVIVCLSSNTDSVCQTECGDCNESKRKRRDTLEQVQQTEFYVTAGPFKIREPYQESEAAADKDERTPFPAYVIAIVAVCGLLAVAIVSAVVLIVFRRRRQNVADVELKNEDSVTAA